MSYQYHLIKPEPEIYQILLEKYNLVADECVFLDDRQDNCEAAQKQGIHAIVFTTKEEAVKQLAKLGYRAELVKGLANGIATFKTAIRPGATITVPTPPRVAEAAPEPKEISKPAEPEKKKPAADTKKKNTGSSNKNKRNTNRNNSSTRRRR